MIILLNLALIFYLNIKVKLLENSGNHLNPAHKIAYSSHSSLASHSSNNTNTQNVLNMQQPHNHHHNQASTNSTSNVNGSLLLFNKQKRSSSIDNVISSFTSNSQPLTFSNAYGTDHKTSINRTGRENPHTNKNNNLYFSGNDLKDLLDSFNINTSKLANSEARTIHPKLNDMDPAVNNTDNSNRSRSLHRDSNSSINYMDKNNQRRKLLTDSAATNQKSSANNLSNNNNNNSNYPSGYNQLMARNQYDLINSQQKFLDDSNQSILFSNNDLNSSSSSHVVPKPPPGNPQRNTNLYPAARFYNFYISN